MHPHMVQRQSSTGVDDQCGGESGDLKAALEDPFRIRQQQEGVVGARLFEKRPDSPGFLPTHGGNRQTFFGKPAIKVGQIGHLQPAGSAPGGPGVDQQGLALQLLEGDSLSVEGRQRSGQIQMRPLGGGDP